MRWLLVLSLVLVLAGPGVTAQGAPTGQGITVAILDSGVDPNHSELTGRVTRVSFWNPTLPIGIPITPPLLQDVSGQGTAVASVVAGTSLGIAPQARILDLQVSGQYTEGILDPTVESAAIEALDYLLQQPTRAQIVVLSFAQSGISPEGSATIAGQVESLWYAGVIVVVPTAPQENPVSSSASVVTVAGTEQCPAAFTTQNLKPDVAAKSQGVAVATPSSPGQPGGKGTATGTAYAAAHAGGALALLRSAYPELAPSVVTAFLRNSAMDLGEVGPDSCSGFGAIDAPSAILAASKWRDPMATSGSRESPLPALLLLAPLGAAALRRRR